MANFMSGINMYILPAGIGKIRTELFRKQLEKYGGKYIGIYENSSDVTHILVDEKMEIDRLCRIMKIDDYSTLKNTCIVKSLWLSKCISMELLIDTKDYTLNPFRHSDFNVATDTRHEKVDKTVPMSKHVSESNCNWDKHGKKRKFSETESDNTQYGDEDALDENQKTNDFGQRQFLNSSWVCAKASGQESNLNKHITDKLQDLAHIYESSGDRWRALGYQKAVATLKKHPEAVTSWQQARNLPGIGEKLADKIWEILETGKLRKLDELSSEEETQAVSLFVKVWGAGAVTAQDWVRRGWRTLDDLRRNEESLTRQQRIGLRYYDELLERMPCSEAAEIEAMVQQAVHALDPALVAMACGSYRRGKQDCGDVDVLVTHPDGHSHEGVFTHLLSALSASGFLTDDLVNQEKKEGSCKYLGVCQLPGEGRKHRRLDIIVVPYHEFACAQLYFTGSAHFNRSMRHLAAKKGMTLNEHALCTAVIRKGSKKLNRGRQLPTPTEESIFQHLGLPYRTPEERDH